MDLHGHGVGRSNLVAPVPPAHRDESRLGSDDAAADGGGHLFGALGAEADVAVGVTHQHGADETIPLSSGCHLLHRVDFHDFILERAGRAELVDDLVFLNGQRMEIDVLQGGDLMSLDQPPQFCYRNPLLLLAALLALALALAFLALALATKALAA